MSEQSTNECVRVEREGRVVIVTIDRPEALNALNSQVLRELTDVMVPLDNDPGVGCFVLTGSAKAFAAGADIAEMRDRTYPDAFLPICSQDGRQSHSCEPPKLQRYRVMRWVAVANWR